MCQNVLCSYSFLSSTVQAYSDLGSFSSCWLRPLYCSFGPCHHWEIYIRNAYRLTMMNKAGSLVTELGACTCHTQNQKMYHRDTACIYTMPGLNKVYIGTCMWNDEVFGNIQLPSHLYIVCERWSCVEVSHVGREACFDMWPLSMEKNQMGQIESLVTQGHFSSSCMHIAVSQ